MKTAILKTYEGIACWEDIETGEVIVYYRYADTSRNRGMEMVDADAANALFEGGYTQLTVPRSRRNRAINDTQTGVIS